MNYKQAVLAGAIAALASPLAASAQMGPPPEMRAQFQQARAQAKTAAFNDLSANHRAKVQAILAQVQNGSLDPRDAGSRIDAILSPSESQAVLGEAQKMHEALRKAFANAGPPPPRHPMNRKPDAGRFLMMLSMPFSGMRPPR